jgi:hypothetical protein
MSMGCVPVVGKPELLLKGRPIEFLMEIVMRSFWESRIHSMTKSTAMGWEMGMNNF